MGRTVPTVWTAEELERLPRGWRYEIDEGELVIMAPAGFIHGFYTARLARMLGEFVESHGLGVVVAGEAGFLLRRSPDTLCGADVAYLSREKLPLLSSGKAFPEVPPDLVVEIQDTGEPDLGRKVEQYLGAGVRAVWVVDPEKRSLTRHAPGEPPRSLCAPHEVLEEPVLPGFSLRLADLFSSEPPF